MCTCACRCITRLPKISDIRREDTKPGRKAQMAEFGFSMARISLAHNRCKISGLVELHIRITNGDSPYVSTVAVGITEYESVSTTTQVYLCIVNSCTSTRTRNRMYRNQSVVCCQINKCKEKYIQAYCPWDGMKQYTPNENLGIALSK